MIDNFLHDISWVLPFRNDILTPIFSAFTFLGYPTFVTLFLTLLFWLWNKEATYRLVVIVIISSVINGFLKDLWLNPRPDMALRLDHEVEQSYGMPSGHAQVAAVLWLWLAHEMRRLGYGVWTWFAAIFIIIMICLSRLYLAVHDIEDIIVGLGIGGLALLIFRASLAERLAWFRDLSASYHIALIILLSVILTLTWRGLGGGSPSAQSHEILTSMGLLMGWIYGRQIQQKYIKFDVRRDLFGMRYSAAFLTAGVGIISIYALLAATALILSNVQSGGYIRLIILGFYITVGAPSLFKLLTLAR